MIEVEILLESDKLKELIVVIIVAAIFVYNIDKSETIEIKENTYEKSAIVTDSIDFSNTNIDNYTKIKIGDSLEYLVAQIGEPNRIDVSEYGFKWYVYNENLHKLVMVGIDNDKVVALYSNSLDSSELESIKLTDDKTTVRKTYKPLEYKKKGNTRYLINSKDEYDIIDINDKYITIFYDIHNNNQITSYQILNKNQENNLEGIYTKGNEEIKKSFELQIIDLCNSTRVKNNLNALNYSMMATQSSRKHSKDMMVNNYFDHINLNKQTPFDRMKEEGIIYTGAGENIAAGQVNAIYAHEAWMNSLGHRKNILGKYSYIGVGITCGGHYNIYYTQNFYY